MMTARTQPCRDNHAHRPGLISTWRGISLFISSVWKIVCNVLFLGLAFNYKQSNFTAISLIIDNSYIISMPFMLIRNIYCCTTNSRWWSRAAPAVGPSMHLGVKYLPRMIICQCFVRSTWSVNLFILLHLDSSVPTDPLTIARSDMLLQISLARNVSGCFQHPH